MRAELPAILLTSGKVPGRLLPVADRRQGISRGRLTANPSSICDNEAVWTSLTRVGFFHLTRQSWRDISLSVACADPPVPLFPKKRLKLPLKQHLFHLHSVSRPHRILAKVPADSTFRTLYIRDPGRRQKATHHLPETRLSHLIRTCSYALARSFVPRRTSLCNTIFRAVAKTAAIAMNQPEQGHATASAGSLLFASILGCLSVLSACPPEKVHDHTAQARPDWPHDRSTPTL